MIIHCLLTGSIHKYVLWNNNNYNSPFSHCYESTEQMEEGKLIEFFAISTKLIMLSTSALKVFLHVKLVTFSMTRSGDRRSKGLMLSLLNQLGIA